MIKKFKIEKTTSTKAFLMLFIITEHATCNVCKEGRRAEGAEPGGRVVTHFFSFFLSFSFIARIIMSFLKRVMKSRKRSTQCQI